MSGNTERAQEIFSLKVPGQQTQREKILWTQQNRMNGTWVKCFQCEKWRYLKNIFDPVDIPDKWQCSMNLDIKFNSCEEPQSQFNNTTVVKLKYTAGSLVWVNSNRYSRWPGMVDDDPELAQFYWLNPHDQERKAFMYHIVFIDVDYKNTSRQWFSESELVPFTWYNSQVVPGKLIRFMESVRIAREALDMNVFQRLQKFGFARLYRGHIFSFGHAMRSLVVSEGHEMDYESDCTLLSCSDTDDEEYYENLRGGYPGFFNRKKSGVITPYEYFERSKKKEIELKSNSHSKKNNRIGRATSVGPSGDDLPRRGRASSVGPNENAPQRRTSLEHGPPRRTSVTPNQKTPQKRGRASSVSPRENSSQRKPSTTLSKENKKRNSTGPSEYDDFNSRNKRASSVVSDSNPRNRRTSSVARDIDSNPRNRKASSVACDIDSKSRNKRSSSVARDIDFDSRKKRASSVSHDNFNSRNKRTPAVVRDTDSKSRNNKRASSVARDIDSNPRNKRASSVARDIDSKSRNNNKRSSSVARDIDSKSRNNNKRSSSVVRDIDSNPRNRRTSSVVGDIDSKSRNHRASSVFSDIGSNPRNRRASSVFSDIDTDYRKKRASSILSDHSENYRKKRKAALSAPDDYFKPNVGSKRPRTTYQNNSSKKTSRKSLDSSGYAENRRTKTSSTTPSYNFESSSRSRKDFSRFASESLNSKGCNNESNSRNRKDSSKVINDFSKNRRERRAASVVPFSYCETNQRRKRSSSVAPDHYESASRKKKNTPTASSFSGYHNKDTPKSHLARPNYCESIPRKKTTTPTASLSQNLYPNQGTPKFHASRPSNPSGRRLRSQTRNSENYVQENRNTSMNSDLGNRYNSLVISNTPSMPSSTGIPSSLPTNIPIYGHGLIRKTVFEVTTRRWKFIGPNGEYYYRNLVTESRHSRPF